MSAKKQVQDLRLRSKLAGIINQLILDKKMKQKDLVALTGWSQPRASSYMNGRLSEFSADALWAVLAAFGFEFDFKMDSPSHFTIECTNKSQLQMA